MQKKICNMQHFVLCKTSPVDVYIFNFYWPNSQCYLTLPLACALYNPCIKSIYCGSVFNQQWGNYSKKDSLPSYQLGVLHTARSKATKVTTFKLLREKLSYLNMKCRTTNFKNRLLGSQLFTEHVIQPIAKHVSCENQSGLMPKQ